MLVSGEVNLTATKVNPFHPQTEPLFGSRLKREFDFTSRPDHSLPRK